MRNTNKKGFTIVELVVVVAVIAILAAVLIPTFSGIIKKANQSKDQQAIANMNKVVAEAASLDDFDYAGDAINALYAKGYNAGKLLAFTKDHHYAYDFEKNTFCLLDEIDAPLDDVNVTRLAGYVRRMTDKSQYICITHKRGMMESADILYGVTMQERGVTKLLTINVADVEKQFGNKLG